MLNLPSWIKVDSYNREEYLKTKSLINENKLRTVCLEANCPNRYECFSKGTATFMILGDTCTRNCLYCNVKKGMPSFVDEDEPIRIAKAIKKMNLKYAVITCVTRDDLSDGGASQFVKTVEEIRKINTDCKIELLISDLNADWNALKKITDVNPDVLNHNIEVVKELFPKLRPKGNYDVSLQLLRKVKELNPQIKTKSGFMVGFGEDETQIMQTINDLKSNDCEIITIGQYLQPSSSHAEVKRYFSPDEFNKIEEKARELGFKSVVAGPLVRSSYKANECIK